MNVNGKEEEVISSLVARLYGQLQTIPIIDCHTHLNGEALSARGSHDVLRYHEKDALHVARHLLYETPKWLLGIDVG